MAATRRLTQVTQLIRLRHTSDTKWSPVMKSESAQDIVRNYHSVWTSGEVETAMEFVSDDIICRAPGVDREGKDAYREFIAGFAPMLTGTTDIAEFADGDRITLFYYPETAATTTAPAAEFFAISDGLISENVIIFDRLSYGHSEQE